MIWICFASLLISAAAHGDKCISADQLHQQAHHYWKHYWDKLVVFKNPPPPLAARTCKEVLEGTRRDLSERSLAPWRYSIDVDVDRIPHTIAVAKCLCQGCIINSRQILDYNSVPVIAKMMVLRKSRCLQEPDKYVVKKVFISVPVACVCAAPKYAK